jgi:hypothetical protein
VAGNRVRNDNSTQDNDGDNNCKLQFDNFQVFFIKRSKITFVSKLETEMSQLRVSTNN